MTRLLLVPIAFISIAVPVRAEVPATEGEKGDGAAAEPADKSFSPDAPEGVKNFTDPRYLYGLANVHFQFGAWARAEELLQKGIKAMKDPAEYRKLHHLLGQLYERQGQWEQYLALLESMLPKIGDERYKFELTMTKAKTLTRLKRYDDATQMLTGLRGATDNAFRQRQITAGLAAIWREDLRRLDKAIAEAKDDRAKRANLVHALELLCRDRSLTRDRETAKGLCERLTELNPQDIRTHLKLALLYCRTEDHAKAIDRYKLVLERWPREGRAHTFMLINTMVKVGRKEEAAEWAKGHFSEEKGDAEDMVVLAGVMTRVDDTKEAIRLYVKAAEKDDNPQRKLSYLLSAARLAEQLKDHRKALELIEGFMKQYPDDKPLQLRARDYLIGLKVRAENERKKREAEAKGEGKVEGE